MLTHPSLPGRVGVHVGSATAEKVRLYLRLSRLGEMSELAGPRVRIVSIHVGALAHVTLLGGSERKGVRVPR
jgi:hypothetical protein